MYQTLELFPGVTLRCIRDNRFKQGALSIQFLRPMCREEAAKNALLPAILLRGSQRYPDLKQITHQLDNLYGSSLSTLVRRIGDYQATGLYCCFMEDRFALQGDQIFAPMVELIRELLLNPILEDGGFCKEFVESEKRNLIIAIESQRSDKRAYAASRLLEIMCQADSFGVPRLGETAQVMEIDHQNLYQHYQKLLAESPVELFYVGSAAPETVAAILSPLFAHLSRQVMTLPTQSPFHATAGRDESEQQDISQAKLNMGFYTPIDSRDPRYAAMQVCNTVFGGGMTSKLFMQVREHMSLCYAIGSTYYGTKGILTVGAGIDTQQEAAARQAILAQLEACRKGQITADELIAAKQSLLSGLQTVHDSPNAMEAYYCPGAINGQLRTLEEFTRQIQAVTVEDVAAAAATLCYHSSFFLKGDNNG